MVLKLNNIFIGKSWLDSPRGEGIITDDEIISDDQSLLAELKPNRELDRRPSRERRFLYCCVIRVLEALYRGVHDACKFGLKDSVRVFESKSSNT
jgi:hypothetical protein